MHSSTLTVTSALDGGGWSTPRPGRFTPGKDPVPLVAGWASGPVVRNLKRSKISETLLLIVLFCVLFLCKYTGCNGRNGPDFGRVFLMLNYTEKPQNTYIQS